MVKENQTKIHHHEKHIKINKNNRENVIRYLAGLARLIGWYHGTWFDYRNAKLPPKKIKTL